MTLTPPAPAQQTVSALVVQQCLRLAKANGLPTAQFLTATGFTREQLAQAHLQLPWLPVQQQMRQALEQMGDPLLGLHVAALINVATLGVWGYVVQTSTTLRTLVSTVVQFGPLLTNTGLVWQRAEGSALLCGWDCYMGDELVAAHSMDCSMGGMAAIVQTLCRKQAGNPLLEVRLAHAPPRDPAHLRDYEEFFRCPVCFNQKETALVLAAEALEQPLVLADAALHTTLEEHARLLLQKSTGSVAVSLAGQVRAAVKGQLARNVAPTREEVAEELGMSGRTLHRRLQDDGTSFRDILDAVRLQLAQELLRESSLTVEAVAQRLGFQESQSFIRWFRPLAGVTPGEYRQRRP